MYEEFYKLDRAPFDTTPDPAFFFMSDGHQEALAALVYGIDRRKGFISLIGEVGTGKTTVLRAYIESEHVRNTRIIYLFNPRVSYEDLLLMVLRELHVEIPDGETKRVDLLHRVLVNEYKNGHNVVLIVDEAQNIPPETLESMRMLSNLETSSEKLLQIVLSGQPELDDVLGSNRLRQLRQRIAVKVRLDSLTPDEARDYVRYRLRRAGGDDGVFTNDAIDWVVKFTGGNPRSINILCDNALITGYGYQQYPITTPVIKEIAKDFDIQQWSGKTNRSTAWHKLAGIGLALAGVAGVAYLWNEYREPDIEIIPTEAQVTPEALKSTEDEPRLTPIAGDQMEADGSDDVQIAGANPSVNITSDQSAGEIIAVQPSVQAGRENATDASGAESVLTQSPLPTPDAVNDATSVVVEATSETVDSVEPERNIIPVSDAGEPASVDPQPADDTVTPTPIEVPSESVVVTRSDAPGADETTSVSPEAPLELPNADDGSDAFTDAPGESVEVVAAVESVDVGQDAPAPAPAIEGANEDQVQDQDQRQSNSQVEAETTQADAATTIRREVKQGDSLWDMAAAVYGRVDDKIVDYVVASNPRLINPNAIFVGQEIVFPPL